MYANTNKKRSDLCSSLRQCTIPIPFLMTMKVLSARSRTLSLSMTVEYIMS